MPPFTVEQFQDVFSAYNKAIWPSQIFLIAFTLATVFPAIKPGSLSNRLISGWLAFLWLWAGVVYHLAFFARINRAALIFGTLFIVQALVFLFVGVVQLRLTFQARWDRHGISGAVLICYALIVYPVLSFLMGHQYPAAPTFGAPCPTTIFTFGLILWADGKIPQYVLVIPLLWSLTGLSAVVYLGMTEDLGLVVAGAAGTTLVLWRNRHPGARTGARLSGG
ncbi:MAG TPA: DUF6064 family protein [Blastocatellia bacterium]|nr:DUF6064 family protein [Blastocatellia bacterium]